MPGNGLFMSVSGVNKSRVAATFSFYKKSRADARPSDVGRGGSPQKKLESSTFCAYQADPRRIRSPSFAAQPVPGRTPPPSK